MGARPAAAGAGTAVDGDLSVAVNFDYEQAGELKIGQVGIANLRIRTLDVERLVQEMQERVSRAPKLFGRAAVILDFGGLSQVPDVATAQALVDGLRGAGVLPVALAYGTSAVDLLSQQLGLPLLAKFRAQYERAEAEPAPPPAAAPEPRRAARAEAKA
ncbi:septum site-determining protein MinC, partial [Stenotrophomonas indicatrix]|nr:septum site-determining protein MinC [Stenotrophomonas indicatrix]